MQPSVAAAHSVMVSTHTFGSGLNDRLGRIWRYVPILQKSVSVHLRQRGFIIVNEDDTGSCLTHKAARNASRNVDSAVSKDGAKCPPVSAECAQAAPSRTEGP